MTKFNPENQNGSLVRNYYMYLMSIHMQEVITRDFLQLPSDRMGSNGGMTDTMN